MTTGAKRKIVLVTGMARSGTTPIGELLSRVPGCGELYEPMSANVGDCAVRDWYEMPGARGVSTADMRDFLARLETGRLRLKSVSATTGRNRFFNRTRRSVLRQKLLPSRRAVIWKDPFAFFLTPLMLQEKDWPVIVTVRAPLRTVASYKRMSWAPDEAEFLPRAAEAGWTPGPGFRFPDEPTLANSAAILWNLLHTTLLHWLDEGLPLTVIDSGKNISDPGAVAATLAQATGLDVRPEAAKSVGAAPEKLPQVAHPKKRSADSITDLWRQNLTEAEIDYCTEINGVLWEELLARIARQDIDGRGQR